MKLITTDRSKLKITLFSEKALVVLVSIVTLLLQLISFATTWSGSRIYFDGVFPYAALLFAIAIQATAYFFSNSLRNRLSFLKILALCAALCCSTYYSYIGIYNSVNSPAGFLQENYARIRQELSRTYQEELEINLSSARESITNAASLITASYTGLTGAQQNITACRDALANIESSFTSGMRPPSRYAYEKYVDYAAAYQAYIKSASQGNNAETSAARSNILASYGFASMEELNAAEQENAAEMMALEAALETALYADAGQASTGSVGSGTDSVNSTDGSGSADGSGNAGSSGSPDTHDNLTFLTAVSSLSGRLTAAVNAASAGQSFTGDDTTALNQLMQAARLCGYEAGQLSQIINTVNQCAEVSQTVFMADYTSLVASLPDAKATAANTMELKSLMDSEILSAMLKLNSLLPTNAQVSLTDPAYKITDLYLIPIHALQNEDTRMTAFFSLAVAALVDLLSVLFAVSLRARKPLWKKRTLLFGRLEDYAPLIYAALPEKVLPAQGLAAFLSHFRPSPQTEYDGYMLMAPMEELTSYGTLAALLCQTNLAKLIPAGFIDSDRELLLLRARFVFWANTMIYEEKKNERNLRNEAAYE